MARGGRRTPENPSSYSGVGKQSKRTDTQRIQTPNVGDAEELSYGDRQKLEDAQRSRPLGRAPSPRVEPAPGSAGGGASPPNLGAHLFSMPTSRPTEPLTEGMDFGAGAGSDVLTQPEPEDDMEVVLQGLIALTGDASAAQMLDEHREFKAWKANRSAPAPMAPPAADSPVEAPEPEINSDFDIPTSEEVPAGEETELSVETPAEPPLEGGEEPVGAGLPEASDLGNPEMV